MAQDRPPIPDHKKREVRQRCKFCCVRCGHLIVVYHHMTPFELVQCHEVDNLTLLCSNCHTDAHNGLLPEAEVRRLDAARKIEPADPGAKAVGIYNDPFDVILGNNCVTSYHREPLFVAIAIDETPLVWFRREDDRLLLGVQLFNEGNERVLTVIDSELVYRVDDHWDIEFSAGTLVMRDAPRKIFIDVQFAPPSRVVIKRGFLLCNGIAVRLAERGLHVLNTGSVMVNSRVRAPCGVNLGRPLPMPSGFGGGAAISRYTGVDLDTTFPKLPEIPG